MALIETSTELKHEWQFGEYFARTWFGAEYGTHTEWFKGEVFIDTELVPANIQEQHQKKVDEVEDSL
jgi:hypothetical protein